MRTYGEPLFSKNGLALFGVYDEDAAGNTILVGYAILDADGNEIGFFDNYDDALVEIQGLTADELPPPGNSP